MRKLAIERGGKCLSTKYTSNKTKLRWQCKKGHEWEAIPHNIKQGHRCPKCSEIRPVDNDAKIYSVFATNL